MVAKNILNICIKQITKKNEVSTLHYFGGMKLQVFINKYMLMSVKDLNIFQFK